MLKPDRDTHGFEDITYRMDETAEAGVLVSHSSYGSGVDMEGEDNFAIVSDASSGVSPLGVLLTEVVQAHSYPKNYGRSQAFVGGKVNILQRGWVVTDQVDGTPTPLSDAYLGASGQFAADGTVVVGKFQSSKDQDGFAKVFVDLP